MPLCPQCRGGRVGFGAPTCDSCGWVGTEHDGIADFIAPNDRAAPLFTAYAELYEQIAADDLAAPIQGRELLDLEAERLLEAVGPVAGLTVCDVGVGQGRIFERLRSAEPHLLVGVDLAAAYLRRLPSDGPHVRLILANAENLPFREELDLIVASDVLEHVLNPADFLGSAAESLRPGGRLVVKVPYRENLSQYRSSDGCRYPMVHLRTFDRPLLTQALEDVGLRVERVHFSGFYAGRWQAPLSRLPRVADVMGTLLKRRYGENPGPNRIPPRLGRLLMKPVVITAAARRP